MEMSSRWTLGRMPSLSKRGGSGEKKDASPERASWRMASVSVNASEKSEVICVANSISRLTADICLTAWIVLGRSRYEKQREKRLGVCRIVEACVSVGGWVSECGCLLALLSSLAKTAHVHERR